jgi:hypothetical protein
MQTNLVHCKQLASRLLPSQTCTAAPACLHAWAHSEHCKHSRWSIKNGDGITRDARAANASMHVSQRTLLTQPYTSATALPTHCFPANCTPPQCQQCTTVPGFVGSRTAPVTHISHDSPHVVTVRVNPGFPWPAVRGSLVGRQESRLIGAPILIGPRTAWCAPQSQH